MDELISGIVIILSLLVLTAAIGVTLLSAFHSLKVSKRRSKENGIPVGIIGWCTFLLLMIVAIPSLLIGSFVDMCIITVAVMFVVALIAVLHGKLLTIILRHHV